MYILSANFLKTAALVGMQFLASVASYVTNSSQSESNELAVGNSNVKKYDNTVQSNFNNLTSVSPRDVHKHIVKGREWVQNTESSTTALKAWNLANDTAKSSSRNNSASYDIVTEEFSGIELPNLFSSNSKKESKLINDFNRTKLQKSNSEILQNDQPEDQDEGEEEVKYDMVIKLNVTGKYSGHDTFGNSQHSTASSQISNLSSPKTESTEEIVKELKKLPPENWNIEVIGGGANKLYCFGTIRYEGKKYQIPFVFMKGDNNGKGCYNIENDKSLLRTWPVYEATEDGSKGNVLWTFGDGTVFRYPNSSYPTLNNMFEKRLKQFINEGDLFKARDYFKKNYMQDYTHADIYKVIADVTKPLPTEIEKVKNNLHSKPLDKWSPNQINKFYPLLNEWRREENNRSQMI